MGVSTRPDKMLQAIKPPMVTSPRLTISAPVATSKAYEICWKAAVMCCAFSVTVRISSSLERASSVEFIQRCNMRQPD